MRTVSTLAFAVVGAVLLMPAVGFSADLYGLERGTPQLKSAGQLAFGPDGILFVGDTRGAAIFAIATDDRTGDPENADINIDDLAEKLGGQLGVRPRQIAINDLAVNPASGNLYLSLTIRRDQPAIVRITTDGVIRPLHLENVPFAKAELPDAPKDEVVQQGRRQQNLRDDAITDLAFVDGQVLVSGLSSSASPSSVRTLPFPFSDQYRGASLEIYHGAHGRSEDYAPIRTFVPFTIDGQPNLLAGFQCTPLVKFPLDEVARSSKIEGTTVAELGNRNRPLDMIVYEQDGKNYLLVANSARGVMKVDADSVATQEPITQPVRGGGTAGVSYETIDGLEGVEQLDRLNSQCAIVIVNNEGKLSLQTVVLP